MKILFDHQIFAYQEIGGVSRYFCEIMKHIPKEMWYTSVSLSNNVYLKELQVPHKPFLENINFYKKGRVMLELGKIHSSKVIKQGDFDVLHLTHYESYANNKTNKPIVLTYHDKLFHSFEYNKRTIREQKRCFERADAVVAISHNTKKDLIDYFDYPEEKIHVIYHGVANNLSVEKPIFDFDYVLFVGRRGRYKNFENFLYAFAKLDAKDLRLVCTAGDFTREELNLIKQLNLSGRVVHKFASDRDLNALYQNAVFFVFPSKYEGFGMPLLEAMANKCPVLCSNNSAFPEVAGDAAVYFNADDVDSIVYAMEKVYNSQAVRNDLINKGLERVKEFTWEKSAARHLEVYKSLIEC
ncbi:MAG: glycosyltransferase family 4 protein [Bacteroidales bacterium]|nr:glycosyltransferase family 4 protein [Bacteroidales bacterium]